MAIKLEDFIPQGTNIFGARAPTYLEGLISPEQMKQAQQQSLFQGLLGSAIGYLAQPKNQGYGSAIPYLAKGYMQGMEMAQTPYSNLEKDVLMKEKFGEIAKQKEKEATLKELSNQLYTDTGIDMDVLKKINAVDSQYASNLLQTEKLGKDINKPNTQWIDGVGLVDMDKYQETNDITKSIVQKAQQTPPPKLEYDDKGKKITKIWNPKTEQYESLGESDIITTVKKAPIATTGTQGDRAEIQKTIKALDKWGQNDLSEIVSGDNFADFTQRVKIYQQEQAIAGRSVTLQEATQETLQNMLKSGDIVVEKGWIENNYRYRPNQQTQEKRKSLDDFNKG